MTEDIDLRVVVDARWTRTDAHDGISRYGANLVEALHQLHPVTMLICDERQLRLLPSNVPHVLINSPISVRELLVSRTLHRLGADVVFSPMQIIGGYGRRYRLVLTLHDLIYYRHPTPPKFLPLPVRAVWWFFHRAYWPQRVLLNRADMVVTVSETTRELIARYRLTRRPITVVHNAPTELTEDDAPGSAGGASAEVARQSSSGADTRSTELPAGRDLVYMGSFMPYKNVETLVEGMRHLPGYRLHLVSGISPQREAELCALIPPGADVRFWRGISESDYQRLLGRATALVTASRDEGFGLPLIEAMNLGAPVVCSDIPIFREVTGEHAQFFDPGSPADFAAAVTTVDESGVRGRLWVSGREHAAKFTWQASAERLLAGLYRICGRDTAAHR